MAKESFISREVFGTKFPKVEDVTAEFEYNFFTTDEVINERGTRSVGAKPVDTAADDAIDRRVMHKKVPRWVLVSFQGVQVGKYSEFDAEARSGLVSQNSGKINRESHMTTNFFLTSRFQEQGLRDKIVTQVVRLAHLSGVGLDASDETSQSDIADAVDAVTGDYISKDILTDLVHGEVFRNVKWANQVEQIPQKEFDEAQDFKTSFHIDNRFIADIYGINSCKLSRGIGALRAAARLKRSQQSARSSSTAAINMDIDYEPYVKSINDLVDLDDHIVPKFGSVGYTITKSKLRRGEKVHVETFYLDGVHNTQFLDSKVAYGQTYIYEVSTVTLVELSVDTGVDAEEPAIKFARLLVQSNPTKDVRVLCVEQEVPPPPDAIFYKYDYDRDSLIIDWRLPITSQRDIKGFQVFRRRSINHPFALQTQFDFNDLAGKWVFPQLEIPDPSLVKRAKYAVTSYEDVEFDRSSKYIYTVCSVDAHGYLSNYGTQTEVEFDRNTNKIRLRSISQPGAPRQYPNMYISPTESENITGVRLSEDVMRDSMHTKMRVYFDPEHNRVESDQGLDLKHIAASNSGDRGVYKFEILNLDRQKSKTLTLKIKARRTINKSWWRMLNRTPTSSLSSRARSTQPRRPRLKK